MSYQSVYELAKEEQLLQRLAVASAEVARDVFVEGAGVANHDVRVLLVPYAGPRTADWRRFAQEIALLVLFLNPTLTVDSLDPELLAAVAGLWTVYAQILVLKGTLTVPVV